MPAPGFRHLATSPTPSYVGRFAPSPTGPLHFGSLVTAVASYLQAQVNNGVWLIRVEDIDPPREVADSADQILESLKAHGFEWDEDNVLWQSSRLDDYEAAIRKLYDAGVVFPCECSRKQLKESAEQGPLGLIYPGTCRHADLPYTDSGTMRMLTDGVPVHIEDQLQQPVDCIPDRDIGDFPLRRGDGLIAYHLAVTLDDAEQGVTEVVRGIDLLSSTSCQTLLQRHLKLATPSYVHLPLALDKHGEKLSKQTGAAGLKNAQAGDNLLRALAFLHQNPPASLLNAPLTDIWDWARQNWSISPLRGIEQRPEIGHFP